MFGGAATRGLGGAPCAKCVGFEKGNSCAAGISPQPAIVESSGALANGGCSILAAAARVTTRASQVCFQYAAHSSASLTGAQQSRRRCSCAPGAGACSRPQPLTGAPRSRQRRRRRQPGRARRRRAPPRRWWRCGSRGSDKGSEGGFGYLCKGMQHSQRQMIFIVAVRVACIQMYNTRANNTHTPGWRQKCRRQRA